MSGNGIWVAALSLLGLVVLAGVFVVANTGPEPAHRVVGSDVDPAERSNESDRLERIEERLADQSERLARIEAALARAAGTPGSATQTPAGRKRVARGERTSSLADPSDPSDTTVLHQDVPTRHLVLQADERLRTKTDLAGAVARYETLLGRSLDVEQRTDLLRKMGMSYVHLAQREEGLRHLRDAVALGPDHAKATIDALHDLMVALGDDDDRELLNLATRYLDSDLTNLTGRRVVHRRTAHAAIRLKLVGRARESLQFIMENDPQWKAWAELNLRQLDGR